MLEKSSCKKITAAVQPNNANFHRSDLFRPVASRRQLDRAAVETRRSFAFPFFPREICADVLCSPIVSRPSYIGHRARAFMSTNRPVPSAVARSSLHTRRLRWLIGVSTGTPFVRHCRSTGAPVTHAVGRVFHYRVRYLCQTDRVATCHNDTTPCYSVFGGFSHADFPTLCHARRAAAGITPNDYNNNKKK